MTYARPKKFVRPSIAANGTIHHFQSRCFRKCLTFLHAVDDFYPCSNPNNHPLRSWFYQSTGERCCHRDSLHLFRVLFVSIKFESGQNFQITHSPCIISGTFILNQLYPGHLERSGADLWPQTGSFSVANPTALLTNSSSREAGTGRVSTFLPTNTDDQLITTITHNNTKYTRGHLYSYFCPSKIKVFCLAAESRCKKHR